MATTVLRNGNDRLRKGNKPRRHMWVEFVGSLLCTERFSPGTPVSPLLENQHLTWFVLIVNFSLQCPQLVLQR